MKHVVKINIEKLKLFILYLLEQSDVKAVDKILFELYPLMSTEQIIDISASIQDICEEIAIRGKVSETKIVEGWKTCRISDNYYETNHDVDFCINIERYINNNEITEKGIEISNAIEEMYNLN